MVVAAVLQNGTWSRRAGQDFEKGGRDKVPDAALAPGDRRLADPDSRLALETLVDTLLDHARALGRQP